MHIALVLLFGHPCLTLESWIRLTGKVFFFFFEVLIICHRRISQHQDALDLSGPLLYHDFPGLGYLNQPGLFDEPLLYQWGDLHRPQCLGPFILLDLPESLRPEQLNPPRLDNQPPVEVNDHPIVERRNSLQVGPLEEAPEYLNPLRLFDLHWPEYLYPFETLDLPEPLRPEQLNPIGPEDQPLVVIIDDHPIVERQDPPPAVPELCNGKCKGNLM